ncbi:MAG: O-antigen ligase family protein [Defluviitaleaceae bacterium]|nr:O-antigen ligase family protein [Defluviitaleaceae bacterium]MCL2837339.1 O-antigen ligase family protein [Defluviitaleaceae bacterium]
MTFIAFFLGKIKYLFKNSGTGRVVAAVSGFFRRIWNRSLLRHLLAADNPAAGLALERSVIGRLGSGIGRISRSRESSSGDNGFILGGLGRLLGDIPYTSSFSFGLLMLGFGCWAVLTPSGLWRFALMGLGLSGIVLMIVNRSFWNLFGSSRVIKFIAGFFGFEKEMCAEHRPEVNYRVFYLIIGLILGGMFRFLDLTMFVMAAGALTGGVLVLYKTEVGVYAAAFLLPIVPTRIILGICAVTVLSYFVKLFIMRRGELPFRLGALDAVALLFAVTLGYSVVVSYRMQSSMIMAATYILFILFFIAAKNTLRTRRMIFAAVSLLALSGLIVAAFGVYQRLTGRFIETMAWIDDEMFEQATSRIYSTLENPNVLGEYLIFVISLTLGMLYYLKNPVYKLGTLGILGISGMCMLFTQSRGAWLGLIFAIAVFALMHDRRMVLLGIIGILVLPAFLPETVIMRFLSIGDRSDSSTSYRVNIWLGSIAMIRTTWLSGIGPGVDSFRHVYQEYAFNAVEAPHSHNLFLQVIIDQGVFGFIIFMLLLFTYFKYIFNRYRRSKDPFVRAVTAAIAAGMFGYLVQGMTDNVWYNYRIVAYFWFITALCGALYELHPDPILEEEQKYDQDRKGSI